MASSSPEVNLSRAKDLGEYSNVQESSTGNGRPHEKSRVLAAEEVDINRMCTGCGKNMRKVKSNLVCSCKKAIHCSKDCLKSSNHKCGEPSVDKSSALKEKLPGDKISFEERATEVLGACRGRYLVDRKANKGPSSDKITRLQKVTKGNHQRILMYAERGNPMAAYIVGSAYAEREFDPQAFFSIPFKYKAQSVAETHEIAVKWLKVAAEGGVPEAMFSLFIVMVSVGGLKMDHRVADYWLAQAHATGQMDYLIQMIECPWGSNFPGEFSVMYNQIIENCKVLATQSVAALLMATRYQEIKAWDGKTAMGETFYGFSVFKLIMESIGELKNDQSRPSFIDGEKKSVIVVSARPGHSDLADKCYLLGREENNIKFVQGVKEKLSLDYQLVEQTSNVDGRTSHLISCKHFQANLEEEAKQIKHDSFTGLIMAVNKSLEDIIGRYKSAGKCKPCVREAKQRLRAVSLGQFSISLTPVFDDNFYAARYANEEGIIMQDVFEGYSKPYMKQALQCLMSNPADLHPLAVAELAHLFWPIIWFWGSVYRAVQETCNGATLDAIYHSLGQNINASQNENASALAAFPEAAAGEWRIACGSDDCPRVDHEVKFNICTGCKMRRYCDPLCQRKDWPKHKQNCKATKKEK